MKCLVIGAVIAGVLMVGFTFNYIAEHNPGKAEPTMEARQDGREEARVLVCTPVDGEVFRLTIDARIGEAAWAKACEALEEYISPAS